MQIGRIGQIKNIGGVVNLGQIHGDVIAGIDRGFKAVGADDRQPLETLREELIKLANATQENVDRIDNPSDTLNRVGKLSDEILAETADKPLIERYLELISSTVSKVPGMLQSVSTIKKLVEEIFV